jgi:putative lipoprotein
VNHVPVDEGHQDIVFEDIRRSLRRHVTLPPLLAGWIRSDRRKTRMNRRCLLVFAGVLLLVAGCSGPNQDDESPDATQAMQTLTGEVFYLERRYLPAGAKLHITLKDVSKVGAPSTVIATSTTLLARAQPYQFALEYSPADIDASKQYTLHASITFYEELLFTSAKKLDPFKHPEETIRIQLKMVGPPGE